MLKQAAGHAGMEYLRSEASSENESCDEEPIM